MLIEPEPSELELGEVQLYPNIEHILADEQWIDDATGIIPHCLSILKTCRYLTERLTALTMGAMHSQNTGLTQIIDVNNFFKRLLKENKQKYIVFSLFLRVPGESQVESTIWSTACTHR